MVPRTAVAGWRTTRPVFPEVFEDPELLHAMAYEEYRLRQQAGERPTPDEYRRRFGLTGLDWPAAMARLAPGRRRPSDGMNGEKIDRGSPDPRSSNPASSAARRPSSSARWTGPTPTRPSGSPRP